MTARGSLAALLLPLALLSACGDESTSAAADPVASESSTPADETASATASATASEPTEPSASPLPNWPACGKVWVAGAKIAAGYQGCLQGQQAVRADNLGCSSGQKIVRYDDRFFGVAGGKIYKVEAPLDKDKQYIAMVTGCRG